jgi:hypothetical protein
VELEAQEEMVVLLLEEQEEQVLQIVFQVHQ